MIHHKHRQTSLSDESGFTIIESLVGLLVAAFLLAAIAPVIVLSVATRVQARRIELATDAAKSYIDGLKSGVITTAPPTTGSYVLKDYPAPSLGTLTCSNANDYCSPPSAGLYCIDGDGGGCSITSNRDFVIQTFRYNLTSTSADPKLGYSLGLRVYRADGFVSDGVSLKSAPNKQATFTGGIGDRKTPLVEMTTEITNKTTTFTDFCDRLKPATTNDQSQC